MFLHAIQKAKTFTNKDNNTVNTAYTNSTNFFILIDYYFVILKNILKQRLFKI